jgi:hypothetical protein
MRWWLGLLRVALRASAERFAARLFALVAGFVAVTVVATVVGSLGLRLLTPFQERRLERRWEQTVASPETILARYPPRGANRTAVGLEQAAAELGLDLVPASALHRRAATADGLGTVSQLRPWCQALVTGSAHGLVRPPQGVRDVLTSRQQTWGDITTFLLSNEPPRWEENLSDGLQAPLPNLVGLVALQRWLAAAAAEALADGDQAVAETALEAGWKLNQEILQRPEIASRLAAFEVLQLQLALLRQLPSPRALWVRRLETLDPAAKFGEALLVDGYLVRATVTRGSLFEPESAWGLLRSMLYTPFTRWMLVDGLEVLRKGVVGLTGADLQEFDPDAYYARLHGQIPRWNFVAREALSNHWSGWPRAVRLGLGVELTAAVIRVRASYQEPEDLQELERRLPFREVSRVPEGSWEWTREDTGIRIRLVGAVPVPDACPGSCRLPLGHMVLLP